MSIVVNGSGTITGISTGGLPDGSVDNDTVASGITSSKLTGALPAISGANLTGMADLTAIENNIAMLAFYRATDHSKNKYSLVDQVIDDFNDNSGIDASASTNETLTSGYYSGSSTSAGTPVQHLGGVGGASNSIQSFTVPANVTTLALKAWGAAGGTGTNSGRGGGGGFASGNLAVTFGAFMVNPSNKKYFVRKALMYDETGVFIMVSGYFIFVLIYFSDDISANHT